MAGGPEFFFVPQTIFGLDKGGQVLIKGGYACPPDIVEQWKNLDFCDGEVQVQGEILKVHRCVMAAHSKYMRSRYQGDGNEGDKVILGDMSVDSVKAALDFCYTGECTLENKGQDLMDAIEVGAQLKIDIMTNGSAKALEMQMSPDVSLKVLFFLENYQLPDLKNAAYSVTKQHFEKLCKDKGILSLPFEVLLDLVKDDGLIVGKEEMVWEAVTAWVEENSPGSDKVTSLLESVRFAHMSQDYVDEHLRKHDLVRTVEHMEIIATAFQEAKYNSDAARLKRRHIWNEV